MTKCGLPSPCGSLLTHHSNRVWHCASQAIGEWGVAIDECHEADSKKTFFCRFCCSNCATWTRFDPSFSSRCDSISSVCSELRKVWSILQGRTGRTETRVGSGCRSDLCDIADRLPLSVARSSQVNPCDLVSAARISRVSRANPGLPHKAG